MQIDIVGVPVDLGAGRRGVDMGPSAIRYAGLAERLRLLGHSVVDHGNIAVPLAEQITQPQAGERLRYLQPLIQINQELARTVAAIVADGGFPLVLGGDHSLSIGSIGGTTRRRKLGLIWIDAHGDFNTDETTPSGNIHGMSLAAVTGRGHPALAEAMIAETSIAIVGVRDLDPAERVALRASGIHIYTMLDVDRRGMAAIMDEATTRVSENTHGFHVSLDLDALDPHEAPGVGTPVSGGLTFREAHAALEIIAEHGGMRSLDLVEVNPILDSHNRTAEQAVQFALSAFGKRIL